MWPEPFEEEDVARAVLSCCVGVLLASVACLSFLAVLERLGIIR